MNNIKMGFNPTDSRNLMVPIFLFLFLAFSVPTSAATLLEIISMSDDGVSADIIIEVIDATGFPGEIDYDTLEYLANHGVDEAVLNYLISYGDSDDIYEETYDETYEDDSVYSNWNGGEGFHSDSGYNPLNNRESQDTYWEGPYYRTDYPNGGIYVYEPPVYYYDSYYNRYRSAPRYYSNNGYWDGNNYVIYDRNHHPYYHNGHNDYYYTYVPGYGYVIHYYDNNRHDDGWFGGWYGDYYYDGHRSHWNNRFNIGYHDDDFNFRISF